jgi:hypothetical protein
MCALAHYQHGASIGLSSKHRPFFFLPDSLTKTFHYFKVTFLGHSLVSWKKFMVHNALRIEENCQLDFDG